MATRSSCASAPTLRPIGAGDRAGVQRALRTFVPDVEVLETAGHDRVTDPFSQGTWMHHRPGDLTGAAPRMRMPHGRIHFAGSDIAPLADDGSP